MYRIVGRMLLLLWTLIAVGALSACSRETGPSLTAAEALRRAQAGKLTIVDIRTPEEWRQTGVGQGVARIDMRAPDFEQQLVARLGVDRTAPVALICRTGNRSGKQQRRLTAAGFTNVINIAEGMAGSGAGAGWIRQGLPVMPCLQC